MSVVVTEKGVVVEDAPDFGDGTRDELVNSNKYVDSDTPMPEFLAPAESGSDGPRLVKALLDIIASGTYLTDEGQIKPDLIQIFEEDGSKKVLPELLKIGIDVELVTVKKDTVEKRDLVSESNKKAHLAALKSIHGHEMTVQDMEAIAVSAENRAKKRGHDRIDAEIVDLGNSMVNRTVESYQEYKPVTSYFQEKAYKKRKTEL